MPVDAAVPNRMTVRSGQGDYDVTVIESLADIASFIEPANALIAIDERVLGLYPQFSEIFGADRIYRFPATEEEKTLAGVERLCTFLQRCGASKRSHLVVVGGGIAQDIGTFAAHIYYRGIPFTYVPTTLLSMADSCIGAKCGVNLGSFKNQLGFFQSPARVVVWREFLETLHADDVRSGYGEILKLAITAGEESFEWLERRLNARGLSLEGVDEAIMRSLETKRAIIERDEYERELRKILNYGHTFGHALEAITHHQVPHGLAVAWGVDVANFVAMKRGLLAASAFERVHPLIAHHFACPAKVKYDGATLVDTMRRDKKAAADTVTLVLPESLGNLQLVPTKLDQALAADVDGYIAQYDIFR